jgi:uncharacterized protein YdaU (DUF1376 family)
MSMHWFPFYHADYLADTSRLSPAQHGVYLLLLLSFFKDGPLPNNPDTLCRIAAGAAPSDVQSILERYWVLTDAGWVNPKMDEIRTKAIESSKMAHDRAILAAQARWKALDAPSNANSIPSSNAQSNACDHAPSNAYPRTHIPDIRKKKRERDHFVIPTPDAVREYAKSIGYLIRAELFCDHYTARGWRLKGGQPMKDWRAAVRTWKARDEQGAGSKAARRDDPMLGVIL